jgi:drug/metabolite transporter (DMT)-like permease
MLGGILALLSAVTFALSNATVRRGVLTGTVLQAVAISLLVGLPLFLAAMAVSGGFAVLMTFDMRMLVLLAAAGLVHFALARYCNYRATQAIGANLVAPVQQYSQVITLLLAISWLGEALTPLRILGIVLVLMGPALTLRSDNKAKVSALPSGVTPFAPQYREGYLFAFLSSLGFGLSPILISMAFEIKGLVIGIAGGLVSYVAATLFVALAFLLPGQRSSARAIDRESAKWFLISGAAVGVSHLFRYMALAIAPVSVVSPIQRLSMIFRLYLSAWINPHHEVFGGRIIAGTLISFLGAITLSLSANDIVRALPLPPALMSFLTWSWVWPWHLTH